MARNSVPSYIRLGTAFRVTFKSTEMHAFRTELKPSRSSFEIHHQSNILCVGSCFAENIGTRLSTLKFSTIINPFGIVYNPVSIGKGMIFLLDGHTVSEKDIFQYRELWHSKLHHERFSKYNASEAIDGINRSSHQATLFIDHIDYIFITLGTAHVYVEKETGEVVANCHKLPSSHFERKLLDIAEVEAHLQAALNRLKMLRPNVRAILTVSPVRHIRDGIIENQCSKSILRVAVANVCAALDFAEYFPAYEIMLDDLRDYRFYEPDMIHPNQVAIDYIWDFFSHTYFSSETKQIIEETQKIQRAAQHRSFHPKTQAHQTFVANTLLKIEDMERSVPFLNFGKEREVLLRGGRL